MLQILCKEISSPGCTFSAIELVTVKAIFYFSTELKTYTRDDKPEYGGNNSDYMRDLVSKWSAGRIPGITT